MKLDPFEVERLVRLVKDQVAKAPARSDCTEFLNRVIKTHVNPAQQKEAREQVLDRLINITGEHERPIEPPKQVLVAGRMPAGPMRFRNTPASNTAYDRHELQLPTADRP